MEWPAADQGRLEGQGLAGVVVRPIRPEERGRWDRLMRAHYYLGFAGMAGRALRQVAEAERRWLALLGWQAAALMCAPRDRWIGWPRPLQFQHLHLLANNNRFLILPGVRVLHLASRVLALSLQRQSRDWQAHHGHPLLLAESFVDPARFRATCYRAANWQCLGLSRGFARHAGRYVYHGQPKTVWVYPLHRHARTWLGDPHPHPAWSHAMQTITLSSAQIEALQAYLRAIPDPRTARGRQHRLATVLSLALAATLAGARGYLAIAEFAARLTQAQLKRLRAYYDRTEQRFLAPSEPTFRRALQRTDPQGIERAFGAWLASSAPSAEPIAIDGKSLKGARRNNGTRVHLLSALLHHQGSVLAQREVGQKTNEIPEPRALLEDLDIAGRTITADALHTQRETARFLIEDKQAHYFFTVKDNNPPCSPTCRPATGAPSPPQAHSEDKAHGQLERRTLQSTTALNRYLELPHVGQACLIQRTVVHLNTGHTTCEHAFCITDLHPEQASPAQLLALNRGHWAIENRLHYVRDLSFDEDRCQARTGYGPQVLACLRNAAISLLRQLAAGPNMLVASRTSPLHPRTSLHAHKLPRG